MENIMAQNMKKEMKPSFSAKETALREFLLDERNMIIDGRNVAFISIDRVLEFMDDYE